MSIFDDLFENEFTNVPGEGPFYTSYLYQVQEDFPNIGLKSCPWNQTETPKLYAVKDTLIEHFNFIYRFREIGSETEERWQYTVDRVFDNIKRKYEFAFNIFEDNDLEVLGKQYSETIHRTSVGNTSDTGQSTYADSKTGSDSTTSKINDRPVQALSENGEYASAITKDTVAYGSGANGIHNSSGTKNVQGVEDVAVTRNDKDEAILKLVDDAMDDFIDLIDKFVDEFHVCFMSTLGRI